MGLPKKIDLDAQYRVTLTRVLVVANDSLKPRHENVLSGRALKAALETDADAIASAELVVPQASTPEV